MQQVTEQRTEVTATKFHLANRPEFWLVGVGASGPHEGAQIWVRRLWDRFLGMADELPDGLDRSVYVSPCHGRETEFTIYIGYTMPNDPGELADGLVKVRIPAHTYGVGTVSGTQAEVNRLYGELPAWMDAQGTPTNREILWLEIYPDPPRPIGEPIDLEVWLPVS